MSIHELIERLKAETNQAQEIKSAVIETGDKVIVINGGGNE